MFSKVRNRMESDEGFTLIELLVVILIIGILAAIAIPSFLNQREKGQDACAKSMARTMQTAMETVYIDNNTYAAGTPAGLYAVENQVTAAQCGGTAVVATGPSSSAAGVCAAGAPAAQAYCVSATSAATDGGTHTYAISRTAAGVISRTCAPAGKGGCVAGQTW